MSPIDLIQIEMVKRIEQDETWYAGERRRCPVSPTDRDVQRKICDILQQNGEIMREQATEIAKQRGLINSSEDQNDH